MKKLLIAISVLLAVLIVAASITIPTVIHKRGDISEEIVSEDVSGSLQRSAAAFPAAVGTDARIMTLNLLAHYESFDGTDARPRAKLFFAVTDAYKPDIIGVQEMCDQWYCCLVNNRGSYKMVRPVTTGLFFRMTALIYNSDTLVLKESGETEFTEGDDSRMRRVVWGVFENRTTGAVFAVTNTHFNLLRFGLERDDLLTMQLQANEQIALTEELFKTYSCPVFTIGDFNAKEKPGDITVGDSTSVYNLLAQKLTDTKLTAEMRTYGSEKNPQNSSNDHIFLIGKARVTQYSILSQNYLTVMSDHYPLFADMDIQ